MKSIARLTTVALLTGALCAAPASGATATTASTPTASARSRPDVAALVRAFKEDSRGPYQAIRWFCRDGTRRPANQRCLEPGGVQHALPKDSVQALADNHGIHLGQILAGLPPEVFWDADAGYDRAKQYVLERYLVASDDGWILRKARYYRGAFQIEDEEVWGRDALLWLLADDSVLSERFFMARQMAQWVPHRGREDRLVRIRADALNIADRDARFMNLRIKIHSQPDAGDLDGVVAFRRQHAATISAGTDSLLARLQSDLEIAYHTPAAETLAGFSSRLTRLPAVSESLGRALAALRAGTSPRDGCQELTDLLSVVRSAAVGAEGPADRLLLLDLSLAAERALFRQVTGWQASDLADLVARSAMLVEAAAGAGFLEEWESRTIAEELKTVAAPELLTVAELVALAAFFNRTVEWSAGLVTATFAPALEKFSFEPLAAGFVDASLRSSILLALGDAVDQLSRTAAARAGTRAQLMDQADAGGVRGVNPGYARGRLEVVTGSPDHIEYAPDRIYALSRPPADLSPVAGILTVSEGNPVSHIQLLARNLGIPNAVLDARQLEGLAAHQGRDVFMAVSPRGAVLMKPATGMTAEEAALVAGNERKEEMVRVPVDRIDLEARTILDLRDLRAADSGRLCGPKAANLGQLKFMFADHVVEGIVIPFGIFHDHLEQTIPGQSQTYWQWLQGVFARAQQSRNDGVAEAEVEQRILADLAQFRGLMAGIKFRPGFVASLEAAFGTVIGAPLGEQPVFIRSDTNMEDLRDFTGAGLNLTLFNIRERAAVLQGIRDVWASPYSERSFRWRQRFLLNPENVYPSILIMPAVNVDKSGVMITTGVLSGDSRDNTIAFNRGVAGAVEGQASETYLLRANGRDELLSPSREVMHTVLPAAGGLARREAALNAPILSGADRAALREMAATIRRRMAPVADGPLDVELGLKDGRIWLFQVRPFVENKRAQGSFYLQNLDPSGLDGQVVPWRSTPADGR